MADPIFLLICTVLMTIPNSNTYSILNRISNQFDNQYLLYNRTSNHLKSIFDKCVPVQAVRELGCPFHHHPGIFQSICQQHQLCYACGFVHNITPERCVKLSRMHMRGKCSRKSDCFNSSSLLLTHLESSFYRRSEFSFECYDQCVLNYLYTIFE